MGSLGGGDSRPRRPGSGVQELDVVDGEVEQQRGRLELLSLEEQERPGVLPLRAEEQSKPRLMSLPGTPTKKSWTPLKSPEDLGTPRRTPLKLQETQHSLLRGERTPVRSMSPLRKTSVALTPVRSKVVGQPRVEGCHWGREGEQDVLDLRKEQEVLDHDEEQQEVFNLKRENFLGLRKDEGLDLRKDQEVALSSHGDQEDQVAGVDLRMTVKEVSSPRKTLVVAGDAVSDTIFSS